MTLNYKSHFTRNFFIKKQNKKINCKFFDKNKVLRTLWTNKTKQFREKRNHFVFLLN